MEIQLLCVGKTDRSFWASAFDDYAKRLKYYVKFSILYLPNAKAKKKINSEEIKNEEARLITQKIKVEDVVYLLDEKGNKYTKYGYQFWLAERQGLSIYYSRGIWGQYVICIPENNMIIVRLGRKFGPNLPDGHHEDFYQFIDAALEMYP